MEKRNINCDILRILAFFLVLLVHFLSFIDFNSTINNGPLMLVLNVARCLFMTCVPLFIIITGYLMNKKELNKNYIKKLGRIIITYILCSIACLISLHILEHREFSNLKGYIASILSFKAAPYSWYVNMYIGLYLIIPFLNIIWNNLKNKKSKQYLIIILIILFVLPTLTNIYNFSTPNWWSQPSLSKSYQLIIPNYWLGNGYPILYYFIGCYLKDFKLNINKAKNIIYIILFMVLFGIFNFYRNYNSLFDWGIYTDYYSFEVFIISALVANLVLNNLRIKIKKEKSVKLIAKISYLTFGAYLLSRIFDVWFYPYLIKNTLYIKDRIIFCIPIILLIAVCSLLSAYIIEIIQVKLSNIMNHIIYKKNLG